MKPHEGNSVQFFEILGPKLRDEVWFSNTEYNRSRPHGRPAKPLGENQDPPESSKKPAHVPLMRVVGWEPTKAVTTASTPQEREGFGGQSLTEGFWNTPRTAWRSER